MTRIWIHAVCWLTLAMAFAAPARAQLCTPPTSSAEARLLAFNMAPIAFSLPSAPTATSFGSLLIAVDVVPLANPDASIATTSLCYPQRTQNSHLSPLFARPRVAFSLPWGFVLEGSYLPPIKFGDAQPNLASFALSEVRQIGAWDHIGALTAMLRMHTTFGTVHGPITCSADAIQTSDPGAPCYGPHVSDDAFLPTMFGLEGAIGFTTLHGLLAAYAGGGVTWLKPRLQVSFTDARGITDQTRIEVDMTRGTVFGGLTLRPWRGLELSGQVYSVPTDQTTWRFALGYRVL
jgi:hypothetical protein